MANLSQIEEFLKSKQIPYQIVNLGGEVFTVEEVTESGIAQDEIVKTLIVCTGRSVKQAIGDKILRSSKNVPFVALAVRGLDRVDFKKVRKLFGNKSELARPEEVEKVVGVSVGAVCPILLEIPLYFDRKVMRLKHVNMGSGDLTKGLEMDLAELLKAVENYQIADLVEK